MSDYSAKIAAIQQSNAATISKYFSNLPTTTTSKNSDTSDFSGIVSNLRDYSLIKSGAYTKLMKAYYEKQSFSESSVSEDATADLVSTKNNAKKLKEATDAMNDSSLFEKVTKTVKEESGTEKVTTDYDWDKLYTVAKNYVDSYNTTVEDVQDLNSDSILRSALRMTKNSTYSKNILSDIGITINSDNSLTLDENKFKKADINKIKTVFYDNNSYAKKIGYQASAMYNLSGNAALTQVTAGNRTYTQSGNYSSVSTDSLYDSLL